MKMSQFQLQWPGRLVRTIPPPPFHQRLGETNVGELVTWMAAAAQCATATEQKKKRKERKGEEVAQLSGTTVAFITSRFLIFDGLAVHVTYNGVNNSRLPSAAGAPLFSSSHPSLPLPNPPTPHPSPFIPLSYRIYRHNRSDRCCHNLNTQPQSICLLCPLSSL